jgi:hypothetical protein
MKFISILGCMVFALSMANAQSFPKVDGSPLDCAYFPNNFAHDRKGDDKAIMKVIYSRPAKKDREIFGKLVPFDKVWRTGANESTEIKLYQDVMFGDKKLAAGTYSLFTIPGANEWTIIFNSDIDHWGAYSYNEANDVLRVTGKSSTGKKMVESFAIQFDSTGKNGGVMMIAWDTTGVEVPFTY